jgi:hypothetical protein
MTTPSVSALLQRFNEIYAAKPGAILLGHNDADTRVAVFSAQVGADGCTLTGVAPEQTDVAGQAPLRFTQCDGKIGTRLTAHRLVVTSAVGARIGKYDLTLDIAPEKVIKIVVAQGRVVAKVHMGKSLCTVQRVYVKMNLMVPQSVTLCGADAAGQAVEESLPCPSIAHFL